MKNKGSKIFMILALVSFLLFVCPGCALTVIGFNTFLGSSGTVNDIEGLLSYFNYAFRQGGWLICLGGIMIWVPIILGIIALLKNKVEESIEPLKPTGKSMDDPIPPAS